MKNYNVINYHITNCCNYHCIYCFGKFDGQNDPSLEDAKIIVDNIASYFRQNEITDGRINFAGGEPMLCKYLDSLINYANSLGISVSIVTNGSQLNAKRIKSWQDKVSCIGISIDSIAGDTNCLIGRCYRKKARSLTEWITLSQEIHECHIKLKINTVVSRLNLNEDLLPLYRSLMPEKIKLFQMHLVDGINDKARPYLITQSEFDAFCKRHEEFQSIIIAEPYYSMENSYLMVNPEGNFQLNDNGKYRALGDLKNTPLCEILKKAPMYAERYNARYAKEGIS